MECLSFCVRSAQPAFSSSFLASTFFTLDRRLSKSFVALLVFSSSSRSFSSFFSIANLVISGALKAFAPTEKNMAPADSPSSSEVLLLLRWRCHHHPGLLGNVGKDREYVRVHAFSCQLLQVFCMAVTDSCLGASLVTIVGIVADAPVLKSHLVWRLGERPSLAQEARIFSFVKANSKRTKVDWVLWPPIHGATQITEVELDLHT